jgi:hypothetical protein
MKFHFLYIFVLLTAIFFFTFQSAEAKNVVDVVARDFRFEVANEIPSGWTTFRMKNMGHAEHFFFLSLLPDSISYKRYHRGVTRPFEEVLDSLQAGMSKSDAVNLLIEKVPSWYFTAVKPMGGTGIIESGKTAQVTMKLEPGTYAMECYIKQNGVFHTELGMIRSITVLQKNSGMEPPRASVDLTLTNFNIAQEGSMKTGVNTVAVHFREQPEAGLGNDIHLIKLSKDTNMDSVAAWMDWMNIGGLESPAPVTFLGGTQEMPVGYTSYFTVNLKPGSYAFISESAAARGMIKRFTVK